MGALNHIDQSLVGFIPSGPEFEQLVSDALGNAGDPSDGFDADLAAVIRLVSVTDAALDATDQAFGDVLAASAVFDSIDTNGLVEDFNQGAPVIDAFNYHLQLKTVGGLKLPAPAPPPSGGPPLQVCYPAPPAPQPQPAPAPAPQPTPQPCAPGQSFIAGQCVTPAPTPAPPHFPIPRPPIIVQTPGPCATGFIRDADGLCKEQPAPPPPAPAPAPIPAPPAQPCASGFVMSSIGCVPETPITPPPAPCLEGFVMTQQGCIPEPGQGGVGIPLPGGPVPCGVSGANATCGDALDGFVVVVPGVCGAGQVCTSDDPFSLGLYTIDPGFL